MAFPISEAQTTIKLALVDKAERTSYDNSREHKNQRAGKGEADCELLGTVRFFTAHDQQQRPGGDLDNTAGYIIATTADAQAAGVVDATLSNLADIKGAEIYEIAGIEVELYVTKVIPKVPQNPSGFQLLWIEFEDRN